MKRSLVSEVIKPEQEILLKGFIHNLKIFKEVIFLELRDITGLIQCVFEKDSEFFEIAKKLKLETVVEITGITKLNETQERKLEVIVSKLTILSSPEKVLPIQVNTREETEIDTRLNFRWIDLRNPKKALIFKVWTTMEMAFRKFLINEGFIQIHSPKIIGASSESTSELFELNYFGEKAFLAQSPQIYKQMAMASGFEKVFEIGPVFRANPSFTVRHDAEFTMYDVEISFIESYEELLEHEEKLIQFMVKEISEKHGKEIEKVFGVKINVPIIPFPRIKMSEAKEILKSLEIESKEFGDLSPEEEKALSQYFQETCNHEFVFITEYSTEARAFYSMRNSENPIYSLTFDLLFKGIEITSGAKREHRPEVLKQQIIEKGMNVENFKEYLEFFTYGCPPHGGFAIGPTRLLMKLLGFSNVKEVTYVFRGPKRLRP